MSYQSPTPRHVDFDSDNIPYWDRIVAIVAVIAVIVAFFVVPGLFTPINSFVGIVFFSMLLATDKKDRSAWESISFSGAAGLCFLLTFGIILVNPLILFLRITSLPDEVTNMIVDTWMALLATIIAFFTYLYRVRCAKSPGGAWRSLIDGLRAFFKGLRKQTK